MFLMPQLILILLSSLSPDRENLNSHNNKDNKIFNNCKYNYTISIHSKVLFKHILLLILKIKIGPHTRVNEYTIFK